MSWNLTEKGKSVEGIPGIPWRDLTDEEFKAAESFMDSQFPDQKGALKKSGFFQQEKGTLVTPKTEEKDE